MNVLLLTIGSAGDVHPFVGLGLALRGRGHRVTIITNPFFRGLIEKVGLEFVPIGTVEEFDVVRGNPDLWHPTKGFRTIAELVSAGLRKTYEAVVEHYVPGETVVAASSLGIGARIAQDHLGIPMATVHLAPAVMRSVVDPAKLPGVFMPGWMPRFVRRWIYAMADGLLIDPLLAPAVNDLRRELGLEPVRGILKEWWNSPELVIGLFPEWFAKPAEDWPRQVRLAGFPMFDERGVAELPAGLEEFLAAGEKPVVFTPGSAMWHAHGMMRESVSACLQIGCRGILLTSHADHVPRNLPESVRAFSYVPFSEILPRCSAIVHHGGIGTSAQAMAAGVKQLVTPFAHDQFDNARRMERLGVSRTLKPGRYFSADVARRLRRILGDEEMQRRCDAVAGKFIGAKSLEDACGMIEGLWKK